MNKRGRPTKYTPEIAEEICERLSGGEPLAAICRDDNMPKRTTVHDWRKGDAAFSERFARARDDGFDCIAAEALRIADTPVEGIRTKDGKDGLEITKEDMLGHRRLQIETRLKLLAKWDPKRYGEKIDVEHTGDVDIHVIIGGNAKVDA